MLSYAMGNLYIVISIIIITIIIIIIVIVIVIIIIIDTAKDPHKWGNSWCDRTQQSTAWHSIAWQSVAWVPQRSGNSWCCTA